MTSGPQPLVSVSPRFLNLPFGSLAASGLSFTQCPPLPLVHFPLLKSLFSSVFSFQDSGPGQVQHHPSHLVRPALWLALCSLLPLMGDRQRRERLASPRTDLGPAGSPWPEMYKSDWCSNLVSCSGWKSFGASILNSVSLLPLSFSVFHLSSLYLSPDPYTCTPVPFILKTSSCLSLCHWYPSFTYLCLSQLLMQVSANTMGLVAHLLLERESSPHRPILQPWVTWWDFREQIKTRACHSPSSAFAV